MKLKILKPSNQSGYFKNQIIEIEDNQLEEVEKYNEVEVIEDEVEKPAPVKPTKKKK